MSFQQSINEVLRRVIPKSHSFRATLEDAGFDRYQVLRVVTPAWRSTPRFKRILKVQKAMDESLPRKQLKKILRVSVLTAAEYARLFGHGKPFSKTAKTKLGNGH